MAQAPHPRMHGLTHLTGGADPIPGLLPKSGTVEDVIVGTFPGAYYKLNETTGDWADSSGAGRTATYVSRTGTVRGTAAQLDEGDGALCVTVAGPAPAASLSPSNVAACTDSFFQFAGVAPFTVSALINPTLPPVEGSIFSQAVCGNVSDPNNGAKGWGLFILSDNFDPDHSGDLPAATAGRVCFRRSSTSGSYQQAVGPVRPLTAGSWVRITGVFDGTGMGLWFDDSQVAGTTSGTISIPGFDTFRIGDCGINEGIGGTMAPFNGLIDSVIVWDRALTGDDIAAIIAGGQPAGSQQEWVLAQDENGNPVWQQPGVTVEHGDGTPDPEPVSSIWAPSGSTSVSGWHLDAHYETVVLYESSPGRFDVPSMKWVRVPFNTVRIWRTWEPTVGVASLKTEWLPDDRGLTTQARDGLLHIAAGMEGTPDADGHHQTVASWSFSPEWPFLDWRKLPNGGDPLAIDNYVRAARVVDLSHGFVLRDYGVGPTAREFFEWSMFDPADGTPEWVSYTVDNPYPVYPVWPERPLVLPPPYPKMSDTDSGVYYAPQKTFRMKTTLAPGSNLCVQAWQDAPWLLRFSTDTYRIPYPGQTPKWTLRPHLTISYSYDPETIDHTTGTLLA